MAVLDSSFLIALQQGEGGALELLSRLASESQPLRVPASAWAEYFCGFPVAERRRFQRELEATTVFEPVDRGHADTAAQLQHELLRQGLPLSWSDAFIAATAVLVREPLVSNDEAFDRVPGVERVGWAD